MAGILANSASVVQAASIPDYSGSGYVNSEQIVLTTTPTAASYSWGLAIPSTASTARSYLSSSTAAAPTFTPSGAGTYLITCNAAGTLYTSRIGVVAVSTAETLQTFRYLPVTDASVPTPSQGATQYFSSDRGELVVKDTGALVRSGSGPRLAGVIRKTAVAGALTVATSAVISYSLTLTAAEIADVWLRISGRWHATGLSVGANLLPYLTWKGATVWGDTPVAPAMYTNTVGPTLAVQTAYTALVNPGTTGPAATVGANAITLSAAVTADTGTITYAELLIEKWIGKPALLTVA